MLVFKDACPCCGEDGRIPFVTERGHTLHRCTSCDFLYVYPGPSSARIAEAVETGVHTTLGGHSVVARRVSGKVTKYARLLSEIVPEIRGRRVSWLDVGAGYGEIIEAVESIAQEGSTVVGLEPMVPKARAAHDRGLEVVNGYLSAVDRTFDYVSLVHVFSHIPDFRGFLDDLTRVLRPGGELIMFTGNAADLERPSQFPGDWDLPDHLAFCGESHVRRFLTEAGFEDVQVRAYRDDGPIRATKTLVKRILGRPVSPFVPWTLPYRTLAIRARLLNQVESPVTESES